MTNPARLFSPTLQGRLQWMPFLLFLFGALASITTNEAQAQTYTVLHNFNLADGSVPETGLTMDHAGNLYGTTAFGGNLNRQCPAQGCGTVFQLRHSGSGWAFKTLYSFNGPVDGSMPESRVVFGPDGALYGATYSGGDLSCTPDALGCGVVYKLTPPTTFCRNALCDWMEDPIFTFTNLVTEGELPDGDVLLDSLGNIYNTTASGGSTLCSNGRGCGTVFEVTFNGGHWTETVLYAFPPALNHPSTGVIADPSGNLYGTIGGLGEDHNNAAVFQLLATGSGWQENTIYGYLDVMSLVLAAGLVRDQQGNLFGATYNGGQYNDGSVFELSPEPDGSWTYSTIYSFYQAYGGPLASLTMDTSGDLYGTTYHDGANGTGSVFKLTPTAQGWIYSDLHDFGFGGGANPISSVLIDVNGNLYGTASVGGTGCEGGGCGVVWEITP